MAFNKRSWTELISEGSTRFLSIESLLGKKGEIESAAEQVQTEIAAICNAPSKALDNLIALKTKGDDRKSHYEAINQIAHYWHCVIAGLRLFELGFTEVVIAGGAEDSDSLGDVVGKIGDCVKIIGEVYCVSSALWPAKTRKEIAKLEPSSECEAFILYNLEAKPNYCSRTTNIAFYGVDRKSESIGLLCCAGDDGKQSTPNTNLVGAVTQR